MAWFYGIARHRLGRFFRSGRIDAVGPPAPGDARARAPVRGLRTHRGADRLRTDPRRAGARRSKRSAPPNATLCACTWSRASVTRRWRIACVQPGQRPSAREPRIAPGRDHPAGPGHGTGHGGRRMNSDIRYLQLLEDDLRDAAAATSARSTEHAGGIRPEWLPGSAPPSPARMELGRRRRRDRGLAGGRRRHRLPRPEPHGSRPAAAFPNGANEPGSASGPARQGGTRGGAGAPQCRRVRRIRPLLRSGQPGRIRHGRHRMPRSPGPRPICRRSSGTGRSGSSCRTRPVPKHVAGGDAHRRLERRDGAVVLHPEREDRHVHAADPGEALRRTPCCGCARWALVAGAQILYQDVNGAGRHRAVRRPPGAPGDRAGNEGAAGEPAEQGHHRLRRSWPSATRSTSVQLQIEQLQGQINVHQQPGGGVHDQGGASRAGRADHRDHEQQREQPSLGSAWSRSLQGFLRVLGAVIVGLGYLIPMALIAVVWCVVMLVRRRRRAAS